MPPIHDPAFLEGILWPFKVTGAVVLAFLIMDYLTMDDDEDPDAHA